MYRELIIPSAKYVSEELQQVGKLPPIIYPINQRIAYDYIADCYSDILVKKIICHDGIDEVKNQLANYQDNGIQIIEVDRLVDLGYSIYIAIKNLNCPIIINFADTILLEEKEIPNENCFLYTYDYPSEMWTFFEEKDGVIEKIWDRVQFFGDKEKRLFVGVFSIIDTAFFAKCLEKAIICKNDEKNTFYDALKKYSQRYEMKAIQTERWFDVGHGSKYLVSNIAVKERTFNHIEIDKNRGILKKTSEAKEKFIGEILWYVKLPTDIEYVRPRLFSYSTNYMNPYIKMEYYSYHTLHELFLYGKLDYQKWAKIFKMIHFVIEDLGRYTISDEYIRDSLENMYLDKTLERFQQMKKMTYFEKLFVKTININGKKYVSLNKLMKILEDEIPRRLYGIKSFQIIHGDLCFSNILVDNNYAFLKLIDPRGSFGHYDIYGDRRYELAKILHSVEGNYDSIIKEHFFQQYEEKDNRINYEIKKPNFNFDILELFIKVFDLQGEELENIRFIESLLFLSMIPLHEESHKQQYVMLAVGIELLSTVLDIEVDENV